MAVAVASRGAAIPFCRTKRLPCPKPGCPKTYNRPALLEQHLRSHSNLRLFACPRPPCTKTFLRQDHLSRHIESAHETIAASYACPASDCGKAFTTATRLRRHQAMHANREKHRCQEEGCGRVFRKASTLAKHRVTEHEGKVAFTCDERDDNGLQCGKGFHDAFRLKLHRERNHTADRFQCDICPASEGEGNMCFGTYQDFMAHKKEVHPPLCEECGYRARGLTELAQHMETHRVSSSKPPAEKTHRCEADGCGAAFDRRSTLTNHIKNLHMPKPSLRCREVDLSTHRSIGPINDFSGCDQTFSSKARLAKHIRREHLGEASDKQARKRGPSKQHSKSGNQSSSAPQTLGYTDIGMDGEDLEAMGALEDTDDWSLALERAAARGGHFWLGQGVREEEVDDNLDEWDEDEMEMNRLVEGQEAHLPLDPALMDGMA